MKVKIIIATLAILLCVSVYFNIEQNSRISVCELYSDERDERVEELDEIVEALRYEKMNALLEVAELQNEIEECKKSRRRVSVSFERSEGVTYRTTQALEIHSTFSQRSAVVGDIPKGATLEVMDSSFSKFWKVKYNGIVGWVITDTRSEVDRVYDEAIGNAVDTRTLERIK